MLKYLEFSFFFFFLTTVAVLYFFKSALYLYGGELSALE